jgi:hypothetical protein
MGEKQLLLTIKIHNYPKQALVSKATRAKYWKPKDKLLKKFLSKEKYNHISPIDKYPIGTCRADKLVYYLDPEYSWKNNRLHHVPTKTDVLKNPDQVGKEKWIPIKGQDIIGQKLHEMTKGKIFSFLKAFWIDELNKIIKSTQPTLFSLEGHHYPISVHIDYNDNIHEATDLDNYSLPYHKTLLDALVSAKVVIDDKLRYIDGLKLTYTPIEERDIDYIIKGWGTSAQHNVTIKIFGYANRVPETSIHSSGEDR